MKVRCIDDKPHGGVGSNYKLVKGQIYEVRNTTASGKEYDLVGMPTISWSKNRFQVVDEDEVPPPPVAASKPTPSANDSDLDFFSRPSDPSHCKCGMPKKQCGYHN